MKNIFLRRTFLYVPGSSEKMAQKSLNSNADSIILDLEDSVSIDQKSEARQIVLKYIKIIQEHHKESIVRINPVTTKEGLDDLIAIGLAKPDALIIPKAEVRTLVTVDTILTTLEEFMNIELFSIKLIPLVETTEALLNIEKILSVTKRINGVHLGAEDLSRDCEVPRRKDGSDIFYARNKIALAARAFKVDSIDTPFTDIKDLKALRMDTEASKGIGFSGKACIHPAHIQVINDVFSPSEDDVKESFELLKAYEEAIERNVGAFSFRGKMVDKPIADRALKVTEKAKKIQGKENRYNLEEKNE